MKKCPTCNNQYSDDSIQFCLVDGEPLVSVINVDSYDSAPTVVLPAQTAAPASSASGINKFLIGTTVVLGLLLVVAGTALVSIYFLSGRGNEVPANTKASSVKEADDETAKPAEEELAAEEPRTKETVEDPAPAATQTPITVRVPETTTPPPAPPPEDSKLFGAKSYGGSIGGRKANFNLSWQRDSTIAGSFYFVDNPDDVYSVSGSNYQQGKARLRIALNGSNIGSIRLSKTLEGKVLCWQGRMTGNTGTAGYTRFCRYR